MSGDTIDTIKMVVEVQKNGIVRRPDGHFLARLSYDAEAEENEFSRLKALFSEPQAQIGTELEQAFQALQLHGVPRGRAGTIANGIEVLTTRFRRAREIDERLKDRILVHLVELDRDAHSLSQELGAGSHLENCQLCLDIQALRAMPLTTPAGDLKDVKDIDDAVVRFVDDLTQANDLNPMVIGLWYGKVQAFLNTFLLPSDEAAQAMLTSILKYYPFDAICRANGVTSPAEKEAIAQMAVHALTKSALQTAPAISEDSPEFCYECETFGMNSFGIRNKHGLVCWVWKPSKYEGQDERFERETAEARRVMAVILAALNGNKESDHA